MYAICHYYARKLTKIGTVLTWIYEGCNGRLPTASPGLEYSLFRIGSVLLSLSRGRKRSALWRPHAHAGGRRNYSALFHERRSVRTPRSIDRKDGSHKNHQFAYDFLVMGSWPIVAGTVVLAYPIVGIVSSPEFLSNLKEGFYGSDMALQILIFALAFSFINSLFGFILVADNRQTKLLIRNAVGAALTIGIDLILIPAFGLRGAAFTNVLTAYVASPPTSSPNIHRFLHQFQKHLQVHVCRAGHGRYFVPAQDPTYAVMQNKNILILIPFGGIIYIGLLWITRTITPK